APIFRLRNRYSPDNPLAVSIQYMQDSLFALRYATLNLTIDGVGRAKSRCDVKENARMALINHLGPDFAHKCHPPELTTGCNTAATDRAMFTLCHGTLRCCPPQRENARNLSLRETNSPPST